MERKLASQFVTFIKTIYLTNDMTTIKIYCLGTILNLPVTFSPWSTFENNPSGFQRASVSPTPFPKGTGEGSAQKGPTASSTLSSTRTIAGLTGRVIHINNVNLYFMNF